MDCRLAVNIMGDMGQICQPGPPSVTADGKQAEQDRDVGDGMSENTFVGADVAQIHLDIPILNDTTEEGAIVSEESRGLTTNETSADQRSTFDSLNQKHRDKDVNNTSNEGKHDQQLDGNIILAWDTAKINSSHQNVIESLLDRDSTERNDTTDSLHSIEQASIPLVQNIEPNNIRVVNDNVNVSAPAAEPLINATSRDESIADAIVNTSGIVSTHDGIEGNVALAAALISDMEKASVRYL
jgi:hypothetical protein